MCKYLYCWKSKCAPVPGCKAALHISSYKTQKPRNGQLTLMLVALMKLWNTLMKCFFQYLIRLISWYSDYKTIWISCFSIYNQHSGVSVCKSIHMLFFLPSFLPSSGGEILCFFSIPDIFFLHLPRRLEQTIPLSPFCLPRVSKTLYFCSVM